MREVMVHRPQDLEQIDPKVQAGRIAHTVGENKRLLIIDEAERRGIHIFNPGPKKEEPAITPPTEEAKTTGTESETEPEHGKEESKPEPKKKGKKGTKWA
jgi:hypothetical protein